MSNVYKGLKTVKGGEKDIRQLKYGGTKKRPEFERMLKRYKFTPSALKTGWSAERESHRTLEKQKEAVNEKKLAAQRRMDALRQRISGWRTTAQTKGNPASLDELRQKMHGQAVKPAGTKSAPAEKKTGPLNIPTSGAPLKTFPGSSRSARVESPEREPIAIETSPGRENPPPKPEQSSPPKTEGDDKDSPPSSSEAEDVMID